MNFVKKYPDASSIKDSINLEASFNDWTKVR
jgi:hypothetical protein